MAGKPKPLKIFVNYEDLFLVATVTDYKASYLRKHFKNLLDIEKDIVITEKEEIPELIERLDGCNINYDRFRLTQLAK